MASLVRPDTGLDEAAVLSAAHGRRTMDTLRAVAPHLDVEAEARWLEQAELADRDGIVAIPGAQELITALSDDSWAVVTSAGDELARRRLEWAGLPAPRCLIPAEQVRQGKPSPEGYLCAAAALGVDAARCVVLEDSPAGIKAARAAGTTRKSFPQWSSYSPIWSESKSEEVAVTWCSGWVELRAEDLPLHRRVADSGTNRSYL